MLSTKLMEDRFRLVEADDGSRSGKILAEKWRDDETHDSGHDYDPDRSSCRVFSRGRDRPDPGRNGARCRRRHRPRFRTDDPCREELPYLEKDIWQHFDRDKLAVLVIGREEDDEIIQQFVDKHGYTVPFAGDPKMVAYSQYATRFIPRNFVIGPDGVVLYQSQGYAPHEFSEMVTLIEEAVAAIEPEETIEALSRIQKAE